MKARYKIPIIAVISFFIFWTFTPTIALHACAELDFDWRDTLFCNVNGQMVNEYFVLDHNLWSNPVIQVVEQIFSRPSCSDAEFNSSLPPCDKFADVSEL